MNKNNGPVIAIGIIIIVLLAYIAFKPKIVPVSPQVSPIEQSQTSSVIPVTPQTSPIQTTKSTVAASPLAATSTNPYAAPSITTPVGGPSYLVVKKTISSDNILTGYYVWTNTHTGDYKDSDGKIYYDPKTESVTVQFGVDIQNKGTVADFVKVANQQIAQKGYAIVGHFLDGGPRYEYYFIAQ